jgi:hypothetical protein
MTMSRYIIPASATRYHVVVGWDAPLATFFGEVWDPTVPDEDDETACVLWAGTVLGALPTVDALQTCLAAWAQIPPEIIAQLQQDCVNTRSRSPLQERLLQMLSPSRD